MNALKIYASALADAFLSGNIDFESLHSRGHRCLGYSPPWLSTLCQAIVQNNIGPQPETIIDYIYHFEPLRTVWRRTDFKHSIAYRFLSENKPKAPAHFIDKPFESFTTMDQLCAFFAVDENHLLWLSDPWGRTRRYTQGPLQHYLYRRVRKSNSQAFRLLEIPKPDLKSIQRKIYRDLLTKIPIHPNAHGFTQFRSVISYTRAHLDKQWVLRLDLKHFFPSISYTRIYNIFSCLAYPKSLVRLLSLLCTNQVPPGIIDNKIFDWPFRQMMTAPHLPQGAPTSPALSNLAAYKLDCRLSALAERIGGDYSRYADDLLFSGNNYRNLNQLIPFIGYIVADEGFTLNYRKTRVMSKGQRQIATGIVLNKRHNLPREDYDGLKAILHNCVTKGVASQARGHRNFYAFLKGKLSYFKTLNPEKAEKLQSMFMRIDWES